MTTFLLDAPSLTYRAFFAWPTSVKSSTGQPVNAVRGFLEMTTRLVVDRRPGHIVAVMDNDWRPAFRVAAYSGYKAERPEEPPELTVQFGIIAEVLDAAGLVRSEAEGLEADDVIATLIERKPPDEGTMVVTGDRDLLCLVRDPDVALMFTVRGVTDVRMFDEEAVERDYGIPPALYPEFATLRGDPSDGLPGVAGVGPKRAAELLATHGSIGSILEHLGDLPPRLAAAFDQARDYLEAMRTVVPLVRDAPVESTKPHPPDDARLAELAERHNLGSSPARIAQALRGER